MVDSCGCTPACTRRGAWPPGGDLPPAGKENHGCRHLTERPAQELPEQGRPGRGRARRQPRDQPDSVTHPASATASGRSAPAPGADGHGWLAVSIVLIGAFMALLDTTIVNVALPTIRTGLHASSQNLEWILSGYALAYGLALVPAGRGGDRFGHKTMFLLGDRKSPRLNS